MMVISGLVLFLKLIFYQSKRNTIIELWMTLSILVEKMRSGPSINSFFGESSWMLIVPYKDWSSKSL
jgi:hypothetical protein